MRIRSRVNLKAPHESERSADNRPSTRRRHPCRERAAFVLGCWPRGARPATYGLEGPGGVSEGVERSRFPPFIVLDQPTDVGWSRPEINGDGCKMAAGRGWSSLPILPRAEPKPARPTVSLRALD